MPGSQDEWDKDMTEQTARAEDAAAAPEDPPPPASRAAAAPAQPDPAALAAEFKDRLLRTLAEMENLRKRTEREVADARLYGVSSLRARHARSSPTICAARSMRCRRSCARAPRAGAKALIDGVELTERELLKALEKNGIRQFTPQGEKFDPNFHQAMFEVPDASVPAGSVVEVVQPGYMIGDRVLRPALVGVSKGGPKTRRPARQYNKTPAN